MLEDYRLWCDDGIISASASPGVELGVSQGVVYYAGMGASFAPGEVLSDYLSALGVDLKLISGHLIPKAVSKKDTLVAVSLSGANEETLRVAERALSLGVRVVGLSAGGRLKELCVKHGAPHVELQKGVTSRSSFPKIFGRVSQVIASLLDLKELVPQVEESWRRLKEVSGRMMSTDSEDGPAGLATWLFNSPHITAYHSPLATCLGRRLRNMLSENAKMRSTTADILEVQHDGISSWETDYGTKLLLLPSPMDDDFISSRFRAVSEVIRSLGFGVKELKVGDSGLYFFLSSVFFIDLTSIYLALLRRLDPAVTRSQMLVRSRLEKTPP
jgi:glucose/mannose-6-phosphate isomerase